MDIHDFQIGSELGEELVKVLKRGKWEDITGQLKKNNKFDGTMENERLAEKLCDPEAYYRKWNKTPRVELENQLNKNKIDKNYWMVALLCLLVISVIKTVKIKRNRS